MNRQQTSFCLELAIERADALPVIPRSERWLNGDGDLLGWSSWCRGKGWIEVVETGVFSFSDSQDLVSAILLPDVERSRAHRVFLDVVAPLVLLTRGWQALHAAAVLTDRGVIGLCGKSGAGKSTVARIWAGDRGSWADDTLLFRVGEGPPEVVRPAATANGALVGGSTVSLAGLVVLKSCRTASADPEIRPLRSGAATMAILPHALCLDATASDLGRDLFAAYTNLINRVPVFQLDYRQTPVSAPHVVELLERELGTRATGADGST